MRLRAPLVLFLLAGLLQAEAPMEEAESIPERPFTGPVSEMRVFPQSLNLSDRLDHRTVVVQGKAADGNWVCLTDQAEFRVPDSAAEVVRRVDGQFIPVGNGEARIEIAVGGHRFELPITVSGMGEPRPISYVRDIMPILSKSGCNMGTCHGAQKGKQGFKLSLRGYDPEWDHIQLVDDLSSRRFNRSQPRDSLFLLKPTQEVPHEGGFRFAVDSPYYRVLHDWIVEGNLSDVGQVAKAESLEVWPESTVIAEPGMTQRLVVLARYPDGGMRDVTRDAVYSSSRDIIAQVDEAGKIQGIRRGEAAIVVRYEGIYAVSPVSVLGDRPGYEWVDPPANNFVDTLVYEKLRQIKASPSELCSDAEFIRRLSIDLRGVPPQPEETRAFVADPAPTREKRDRLIEDYLGSPDFVDRWSSKWGDLLQANRKFLGERGVWAFKNWIRESVATNKPIDRFVHELLTATGSTIEEPAASYFRVHQDPLVAMENVTQVFLGTRFNCNKCHDHPFERWSQGQYYHLGAYFQEVGRRPGPSQDEEIIYDMVGGGAAITHPRTMAAMPPQFPFEHEGSVPDGGPRRQQLADWLTAPQNPYFAKSIVNRFWSYFLGIGIIDPVDDIRSSNPPSNPELLDALTKDFIDHGFDMKHLMRTITQSRTYQLSISTNEWNEDDQLNFSHAYPRRLTAEQLRDAIAIALDVPAKYPGLPDGFRASQLPDPLVQAEFLDQFGRPPRESSCECERTSEVSLKQALNLINGPTLGDALSSSDNRIAKRVAAGATADEVIDEIYVAILCRPPTEAELATGRKYLAESASILEGAQDLAWALFNSPAFLFNR